MASGWHDSFKLFPRNLAVQITYVYLLRVGSAFLEGFLTQRFQRGEEGEVEVKGGVDGR